MYFDRIGTIDLPAIKRATTIERLLKYVAWYQVGSGWDLGGIWMGSGSGPGRIRVGSGWELRGSGIGVEVGSAIALEYVKSRPDPTAHT